MLIFVACGERDDRDDHKDYRIIKLIDYTGQVSCVREEKTQEVYKNMNFEHECDDDSFWDAHSEFPARDTECLFTGTEFS